MSEWLVAVGVDWQVKEERHEQGSETVKSQGGKEISHDYAAYMTDPEAENDFGALKLGCSYPGSVGNGYYPIVSLPLMATSSFKDGLYVMGYPGMAKGNPVLGQHWEHAGRLIWEYSTLKTLNVDTSPGQSGGPWAVPCTEYGWYYCTVGPHTGSAAFLVGGMNIGHQISLQGVSLLNNL